MTHDIRQRIQRPATPEEKERHERIRQEVAAELPELKQWARDAASRHSERIAVGTVFTAEEAKVVKAIDEYAAAHALQNRAQWFVKPWDSFWASKWRVSSSLRHPADSILVPMRSQDVMPPVRSSA